MDPSIGGFLSFKKSRTAKVEIAQSGTLRSVISLATKHGPYEAIAYKIA